MYVHHHHQGGRDTSGGRVLGQGGGSEREENHNERQQPTELIQQNCGVKGCNFGRGSCAYCPNVDCYSCSKYGQYAVDCRSLNKAKKNTNLVKEEEAKDDGVLVMASKDIISNIDTAWFLDSGASNHMTANKHLFAEMKKVKKRHIQFDEVSKIPVKGRGKIYFSHNGRKGVIEDVLENVSYVPNLKYNLLSLGQLMENGYSLCMKNKSMRLKDKGGQLIAHVNMAKNHTYTINLKTQQQLTSKSKSEPSNGIKEEKIYPSNIKLGNNNTSECDLICEHKTEIDEEKKEREKVVISHDFTRDTVWYLDTGASCHVSGNKHLFVEMQEIEKDNHVQFGDASKIAVKGRGKIYFSHNGKRGVIEDVLEDVYYVPDLKHNLISLGQLMEKGYSVYMKDQIMLLKDKGGQLIARVKMAKNRTYTINLKTQGCIGDVNESNEDHRGYIARSSQENTFQS